MVGGWPTAVTYPYKRVVLLATREPSPLPRRFFWTFPMVVPCKLFLL